MTAKRVGRGLRGRRDVVVLFLPVGIVALAIAATAGVLGASSHGRAASPLQHYAQLATAPRTFLWAWERQEELTYINIQRVGVAYLAGTIHVSGEVVGVRPRMQPLRVPEGTALIAVVRMESDPHAAANFSEDVREQIMAGVSTLIARHEVAAVQIDFDARVSEREGYKLLMGDLRHVLPPRMPLQMTALASWCMHDDWIKSMPVDEVVPMFFNMGADSRYVNEVMRSGMQLQRGVCGSSVGLATYEASDANVAGKRVYWFTSGGWTKDKVEAAEKR